MNQVSVALADGRTLEVRVFDGQDQRVVSIDDRYYRVYRDGPDWYFMLRTQAFQSVRGTWDTVVTAVCEVHDIYKAYETRVRRAKEEAQRARDRRLNAAVQRVSR